MLVAITGGDYVVWDSALAGNHEAIALIAGLALAPLSIAVVWVALVCVARGLMERPRRAGHRQDSRLARKLSRVTTGRRGAAGALAARDERESATMAGRWDDQSVVTVEQPASGPPSGKLAA